MITPAPASISTSKIEVYNIKVNDNKLEQKN